MPSFIIKLDDKTNQLLKIYCTIKRLGAKENGIKDLINNHAPNEIKREMM